MPFLKLEHSTLRKLIMNYVDEKEPDPVGKIIELLALIDFIDYRRVENWPEDSPVRKRFEETA